MSQAMESNIKWLLIGGLTCFLLGSILGWYVKPKERIEPAGIIIKTVRDTVIQIKEISDSKENTNPTTFIFADSIETEIDKLEGEEPGLNFSITHTRTKFPGKEVKTFWDYTFKQTEKIIKEYITKDSLRTVIVPEYISKPFFLDPWFYTSIAFLLTTILGILF